MSRKIFVTYKHADNKVAALGSNQNTTARDFLNLLEEKLSQDHIVVMAAAIIFDNLFPNF